MSVRLTRQQLRGTFPDSTGVFTAQVPAVVQEELKQCQVVLPQLPPQGHEVAGFHGGTPSRRAIRCAQTFFLKNFFRQQARDLRQIRASLDLTT